MISAVLFFHISFAKCRVKKGQTSKFTAVAASEITIAKSGFQLSRNSRSVPLYPNQDQALAVKVTQNSKLEDEELAEFEAFRKAVTSEVNQYLVLSYKSFRFKL